MGEPPQGSGSGAGSPFGFSAGTGSGAVPREAASVILVRPSGSASAGGAGADRGPYEVFLLRRHRGASFMSSAFVFPGGAADPGDGDPRVTAARELFEEAGVLLSTQPIGESERLRWRAGLHAGTASLPALLGEAGAAIDLAALGYFAHWITPSVEPKRFSARFYVAALPAGQTPSFDNRETVEEIWVSPAEALARAKDLRLPPPQVRSFLELAEAPDLAALRALTAARAAAPHPILPRMCPLDAGFALLLPWDPDYVDRGTGDAAPMPADHPLARGPSRFILEDATWKNVYAPPSPTAG
jgi:8-oxo-dGTP pyrophosphatase MutT (NUDIX family)